MLAGDVEHGDSLGNSGVIGDGDVQWMTAGSGIIHQDMPKGDAAGRMYGFQLWANLPARHKMMDPRYRDIASDRIALVSSAEDVEIRVVAGEVDGVSGPVEGIVIDPEYLDVSVPPRTELVHPARRERNVFAYVFEGEAEFAGDVLAGDRTTVLFGSGTRCACGQPTRRCASCLSAGGLWASRWRGAAPS